MKFLISVVALSALCITFAVLTPGWFDLLLIAVPVAVAGLFLLLGQWRRGAGRAGKHAAPRKAAILDGSNIMHWRDGEPSFAPLLEVIAQLKALGFTPGAMFDANAGYLLAGRYMDDAEMAARLGLPAEGVVVVAKGTQADPVILDAARNLGAIVVTNDRFRDWEEDYPEIKVRGALVRGGYRSGRLWLNLKPQSSPV